MSLFSGPEEHDANPPESWEVVKVMDRLWHLRPAGADYCLDSFTTRKAAEARRTAGFEFELWHKEARWYAGETVPGWRPYCEVRAERERIDARRRRLCRLCNEPTPGPHRGHATDFPDDPYKHDADPCPHNLGTECPECSP